MFCRNATGTYFLATLKSSQYKTLLLYHTNGAAAILLVVGRYKESCIMSHNDITFTQSFVNICLMG